jgi:quaternary ammonium compound-resistance protein SugE
MKKYWIIGLAFVLAVTGLILGLSGYKVLSAGEFSLGYFSAGRFSVGIFSSGMFSVGIFSAGIFSVGIFSIGIFNLALFALGYFMLAWKKKYPKVTLAEESEKE